MLAKAWYVSCIVGLLACTSASAECAWVLWERFQYHGYSYKDAGKVSFPTPTDSWEPRNAYITRDACLQGMQEVWKHSLEENLKAVHMLHKHSMDWEAKRCEHISSIKVEKTPYHFYSMDYCPAYSSHNFHCFPDTIDPRKK